MGQPVLDRTELKDKYDITLKTPWQSGRPSREALNQALREQLGLEVVPAREPVEMLVIEKVK